MRPSLITSGAVVVSGGCLWWTGTLIVSIHLTAAECN
jgi:hypothetical protein